MTAKRQSENHVEKLLFVPRTLAICRLHLQGLPTLFRTPKNTVSMHYGGSFSSKTSSHEGLSGTFLPSEKAFRQMERSSNQYGTGVKAFCCHSAHSLSIGHHPTTPKTDPRSTPRNSPSRAAYSWDTSPSREDTIQHKRMYANCGAT